MTSESGVPASDQQIDTTACLPPTAPMDMPRQVLEQSRRAPLVLVMSRLFMRNA